jgi:glycopeptide antibiotics resistance protein
MNPVMCFLIYKNKLREIDTVRIYYFILFLISYGLTEIGRELYRPIIYANHINDFGIADSIGNAGGIIAQIFFGFLIINPSKRIGIRLIVLFSVGYILYEIAQLFLPGGVFDLKDIYGTLLGGILSAVVFLLLLVTRKDRT